jgi:hypothetical protein
MVALVATIHDLFDGTGATADKKVVDGRPKADDDDRVKRESPSPLERNASAPPIIASIRRA